MKYAYITGALIANSGAKQTQEIAEGVLEATVGANDISSCIQDAETIYADAQKFMTDFNAKDYPDALKDAADIVQEVQAAVQDCKLSKNAELAQMTKEFTNPSSLEWSKKGSLSHNHVDIYNELKSAAASFEKNDLRSFGKQIGAAAAKVHGANETQMNIKKENFAKATKGFYGEFGGKFDIGALLFCIYDEDQAALMLDVAYQTFEDFLKAQDIGDKIGDLIGTGIATYGAYQQFEQGLPACEHIWTKDFNKEEVSKTFTYFKNSFKNLPQMTVNVKKHEAEILKEAKAAYGDYEKFGAFMARLMKWASENTEEAVPALGKTTSWADVYPHDNREIATEIFQGFFEGANVGTFNFTNLLICIYGEDQAAIALYEAVNLFEQAWADKDWTEAVGGVIATVAAVQGAEQALPTCEAVFQDDYNWGEFHQLAALTHNKEKTAKIIGENLIFNGVTITDDVMKAWNAFEAGQYRAFGKDLASTLLAATKNEKKDLFLY